MTDSTGKSLYPSITSETAEGHGRQKTKASGRPDKAEGKVHSAVGCATDTVRNAGKNNPWPSATRSGVYANAPHPSHIRVGRADCYRGGVYFAPPRLP